VVVAAVGHRLPGPPQAVPDELVQGIVPSHVFAHVLNPALAVCPSGRVRRAGELMQRLQAAQLVYRAGDGLGRNPAWPGYQRLKLALYLVQACDAAQSATRAPGQIAPAQLELIQACAGDGGLYDQALGALDDVQVVDVTGRPDDAFGIGKAVGEVFEIGGRQQQRGVADAVELERHRYFAGDFVGLGVAVAVGAYAPYRVALVARRHGKGAGQVCDAHGAGSPIRRGSMFAKRPRWVRAAPWRAPVRRPRRPACVARAVAFECR